MSLHPPAYCKVLTFSGNPIVCRFELTGPPGSIYANKRIPVHMTFSDGYPFQPPDIVFPVRIFALNIISQLDGNSRLLHLNSIWGSDWSIARTLKHLQSVLQSPDVNLLPKKFLDIYNDWETELNRIKRDRAGSEMQDTKKYTVEDLSSPSTMHKIKCLSRIDQMHLSIVFLFLVDRHVYRNFANQIIATTLK